MYKGQCIVCRGNVMSDQECRKTRDGRYLHISCFEEDDSRPDSPPPPPPPLPRSPLLQTASFKLPHPSSSTYQEDFQTPSPAELSKVMTHKNAVSSGKSLPATSGTPPSRTSPGTPPHTSPDSLMGPFKTPPASLLNTASSLVTPLNNVRLSEEIL